MRTASLLVVASGVLLSARAGADAPVPSLAELASVPSGHVRIETSFSQDIGGRQVNLVFKWSASDAKYFVHLIESKRELGGFANLTPEQRSDFFRQVADISTWREPLDECHSKAEASVTITWIGPDKRKTVLLDDRTTACDPRFIGDPEKRAQSRHRTYALRDRVVAISEMAHRFR